MASALDNGGGNRQIYFGPKVGWINTPITTRQGLAGGIAGPVIVEEYDSTTVVPPGWHSSVDQWQNVILER